MRMTQRRYHSSNAAGLIIKKIFMETLEIKKQKVEWADKTNTSISGSQAVLEALIAEDVKTIFGYPGGAIMPIYDALFDYENKIEQILVRHEQGAIHGEEGYARK